MLVSEDSNPQSRQVPAEGPLTGLLAVLASCTLIGVQLSQLHLSMGSKARGTFYD